MNTNSDRRKNKLTDFIDKLYTETDNLMSDLNVPNSIRGRILNVAVMCSIALLAPTVSVTAISGLYDLVKPSVDNKTLTDNNPKTFDEFLNKNEDKIEGIESMTIQDIGSLYQVLNKNGLELDMVLEEFRAIMSRMCFFVQ